jgi:hypothetical protein
MTDITERIPNGFRTVNFAEFRANNAHNGFVFRIFPQPGVERAADQALARENLLPKSTPETTPTAVMAGPGSVTRGARGNANAFVRRRDCIAGAAKAERNCLSPAPHARGRRVPDPGPAMIATATSSSAKKEDLFPAKTQSGKEVRTSISYGAKRHTEFSRRFAPLEKVPVLLCVFAGNDTAVERAATVDDMHDVMN